MDDPSLPKGLANRDPDKTGSDKTDTRGGYVRVPPILPPILPAAVIMVGICALLVGLVKVAEQHIGPSRVDEYTALVGGVFTISAALSYLSSHSRRMERHKEKLDFASEVALLGGLIVLAFIVILFAFDFI
jgi:hypothetical protein